MKRRILSALLALCLLLALAPQGLAAGADSGSCGGGVRWAYDGAGTLTISGTGAMPDYDHEWEENPAPWWNYRTEITTVRVESGITRVGQEAFGGGPYRAGYPQLSSVTLAATVREIGAWAFSDAGQLTNITLPAALETIENGAFAYSGLQSVTLPAGLAQLDESAFDNCWDLEAVSVASGNSRYLSDGGVLYETTVGNEKNLLLYPVQKSDASYRVLDGTVRLAQEAFAYNESITAIQLPQGIRDIPDFAFLLCVNLKSVNLPDGLTRVSPSAFWGCRQITRLDIPASVTDFSSGYGPAEDWIGIETQPLAVYFYSSTAPEFNEGIVATRVYEEAPVTIYYPTGATGWDQVMEQEYLQQCMEMGLLSFATWTPGQTPVQPQPDQYARIVRLDPANGAQDVGYDAGNKPSFTLTFDREILAMDTPNGYVFPEVDFDRGTLRICRADTDEVVYEVSYDAYMNDLYPITGTTSSDLAVEGGVSLRLDPFNAHTLLRAATDYYITVDEGFVRFADGSVNPAVEKGDWTFRTEMGEWFSTVADITMDTGLDGATCTVQAPWEDQWFVSPATTYNHDLATTALALSGAAYVDTAPAAIRDALEQCAFDEITSYNYSYNHTAADNDVVAYTFAVKRLPDLSQDMTYLVSVVVKGTSGNEEWYSNFNIGTGDTHRGFDLAADGLMDDLESYLASLGLSAGDKGQIKFLVTGHSRGAAVANLTAAALTDSDWAAGEDVYGYTFATPTVSTRAGERGYENLFNVVSGEDFVTRVPLADWGYRRYGVDLQLPSRSSYGAGYSMLYNQMSSRFRQLAGQEFAPFPNGTQAVDSLVASVYDLAPTVEEYYTRQHDLSGTTVIDNTTTDDYFQLIAQVLVEGVNASRVWQLLQSSNQSDFADITWFFVNNHLMNQRLFSAHSAAGYYSWMSACTEGQLFGSDRGVNRPFKRVTVACPVDVAVYDESGALVASVVDEAVGADTLAVSVRDGVKTIDLPAGENYTVEITAREDGVVDYTVEERTAQTTGSAVQRTVSVPDISLSTGDTLTGSVDDAVQAPLDHYDLTRNGDTVLPAVEGEGGFADVAQDAYYFAAVQWAVENGVTTGTSATTFSPDAVCDRGQMVTFLWRAAGSPTPEGDANPFTDVSADAYYYQAVLWAVEQEITTGTSATTFSPTQTVDRAQAVTFLYRLAGSPAPAQESAFADVDAGAYYAPAVSWAVETGVTTGTAADAFSPLEPCRRGQIVTFLYRHFAG